TASGPKIAMITTTQTSVTRIGSVVARLDPPLGFGLPQSSRSEFVSVLVGFHSATGWSQVGSVASGTNAVEMNVIGNSTVKITCCPTSTVGTFIPRKTPSQTIEYANSSSSANP